MSKKQLTPAQIAKEEERKLKEWLAHDKLLEAAKLVKKQNALRIVVLKETYKLLDGIYKEIAKIDAATERKDLWTRYVDCQNTPYGQRPPELRDYIYQWNQYIANAQRDFFDWMLVIDERSLLNQSPFRIDVSERYLRSKQPNLEQPFLDRIIGARLIIDEINDVLSRPAHFRLSEKLIEDIQSIRTELQDQHWKYLDYMSFFITGNVDREMLLRNATEAEYMYQTDVFSIGLYTNRDVPLAPIDSDDDKMIVAFKPLNVDVKCPFHMNFDGSVLRVVWCSFDDYSDYAPSITIRFDEAEYIKRNLFDSCREEIDCREAMELKALNRMKKERADYEAQILAEQNAPPPKAAAAEDKDKKKKKKEKVVKRGPEPPIVNERTLVDMLPVYLRQEQEEHDARLLKLHPQNIRRRPIDLNQRKHIVLGGTYTLHYLERPVQSRKFQNHLFQRTFVQPDILKYRPYGTHYTPVTFASDCSLSGPVRDQILRNEAKQWDDLIEVCLTLPTTVCWWTQPIVVRWQPWEESDEFRSMREELQNYHLHYDAIEEAKSARLFNRIKVSRDEDDVDLVLDFDLANRGDEVKLFYVMTNHIVPRLSLTYQFECEVHEEKEKLGAELKRREHLKREFEEDVKLRRERAIAERVQKRKEERYVELKAERLERFNAFRAEQKALRLIERSKAKAIAAAEAESEAANKPMTLEDTEAPEATAENPETKDENITDHEHAVNEDKEEDSEGDDEKNFGEPPLRLEDVEIDLTGIDEDLDLGFESGAGDAVEFKNIVQGAPARELFPALGRRARLEIRPNVIRFSLFSSHGHQNLDQTSAMFLSDLLAFIDHYNEGEMPFFKDKPIPYNLAEREESISETEEVEETSVKTKKRKGGAHGRSRNATASSSSNSRLVNRNYTQLKLVPHHKGKWVMEGIYVTNFEADSNTITFKTTNIGTFGFAEEKYYNLPLTDWDIRPNYDEVPMSVKIILTGRVIVLELVISPDGFRLNIIRPRPSVCPVKPPADWISLQQLQAFLRRSNMDIFPEVDAYWYVFEEGRDDALISYKHEPMANHTYACMGYFCQTHHFQRSAWNRLAGRREIIVSSRQVVENRAPEPLAEARITPVDAYFVRTEEVCTPLTEVQLEYHMEPAVQEFSCDMFDLLGAQSIDKSKKKQQNTNQRLRWNVIEFLRATQLFSFS